MIRLFKRLFKSDYSVCTECGVHFETISDYDAQVGILCQTHRKPAFALLRRKEFVQKWAALNWEKLEAQALKEDKDSRALYLNQLDSYRMQAGELRGGMRQCTNPEAITQANLQSAYDHNQGRDPFLWP